MPTHVRLAARACADAEAPLAEAAARVPKRKGKGPAMTAESLRKAMWMPNPPPLFKGKNGRWRVRLGELDAWIRSRGDEPIEPS